MSSARTLSLPPFLLVGSGPGQRRRPASVPWVPRLDRHQSPPRSVGGLAPVAPPKWLPLPPPLTRLLLLGGRLVPGLGGLLSRRFSDVLGRIGRPDRRIRLVHTWLRPGTHRLDRTPCRRRWGNRPNHGPRRRAGPQSPGLFGRGAKQDRRIPSGSAGWGALWRQGAKGQKPRFNRAASCGPEERGRSTRTRSVRRWPARGPWWAYS